MENKNEAHVTASDMKEEKKELYSSSNENDLGLFDKIFHCIEQYDLSQLKNIFKKIKNTNLLDINTSDGKTLLHFCTLKNDESIVNYILEFSVLIITS